MEQHKAQINLNIINYSSRQTDNYPFYEVGQLRRTKMHACLINAVDRKSVNFPPVSAAESKS